MKNNTTDIDKELIADVRNGSTQAFQQLFDRYSQKVYNFSIGYLQNKQDAEEIVQEVFLKIWKVREELSDVLSFNSFIFTIAKNAILNTIRKDKYKQAYVEYAKLHPGKDVLLDEELDFRELEKLYLKSINNLSPKRKEIFLLSKVEGLSNAEIANNLNISVKTVENQMTSAFKDIRKSLSSFGLSGVIFFHLFF